LLIPSQLRVLYRGKYFFSKLLEGATRCLRSQILTPIVGF